MKIEVSSGINYIAAGIPKESGLDDLNKWTDIIRRFLSYSLDGLGAYLFTLAPQEYSLAYDIGSYQELKVGREKVLINYIDHCTDDQIEKIANSEDFSRGLLKIVPSPTQKSFVDLDFVNGNYSDVKEELITCEDDGYRFYWFNPHVLIHDADRNLKNIISSRSH